MARKEGGVCVIRTPYLVILALSKVTLLGRTADNVHAGKLLHLIA